MVGQPPNPDDFVVLVVEDDQSHAALIQAAFAYRDFPCHLHVTGSSEEAMDYLMGRWPFGDRVRHPLPDIFILDLGLPGMGGLDFLAWLNSRSEHWSRGPVIIFTANDDPDVAARAVRLGAREVKVKPADFSELVDLVGGILQRWRPHIA
jgi:DNA-binding response OmpR family regulator